MPVPDGTGILFRLPKNSFRQPEQVFQHLKSSENLDFKRKTPLLGFFRNYLPSRYPTLSPAPQRGAGGQGAGGEAAASTMAKELRQPRGGGGQVRPPRPGGAPPDSATTSTAERAPPRGEARARAGTRPAAGGTHASPPTTTRATATRAARAASKPPRRILAGAICEPGRTPMKF